MMRLSRQELAEITGLIRKHAQAAWFARYFGVSLPVDRHGPIITQQVYQDLIKANAACYRSGLPPDQKSGLRLPHEPPSFKLALTEHNAHLPKAQTLLSFLG